ncbi:MIP family channel protein [Mucilaginibacter sp. BT774]|uniref:MIP family channel protein n=1 Tax=Mucilaginibacter sp. BT774 TaxID=3062276 RepID=UPI002674431C|nr:MIP family channel protein [Mucilaginibacter sp. BT774]MDO3624585.1 MIP family channel protein [Mucilaginibacter sp. BT774]
MKKYVAEFLGTYALVFAGTGAIVIDQETHGSITHIGVAITFGLIVMSMIYALGDISGAHFNPAVSIAFATAKKFPAKELIPYIISQLSGAVTASLTLKYLFPSNQFLGATIPAGSDSQSFILEFILTFFLMLVIINVAKGSKEQGMFAGLAIGSVVALEAMFAGPICGASMNPARSFGPAVVSGHTEHLWIYLVATTLGAILAIPIWSFLKTKSLQ